MDAAGGEKIFRAYRSGLLRKPIPGSGRALSFQTLISWISRDRFPVRERLRFRRVWNATWRGLSVARDGQIEDARRLFAIGAEELAALGPGSECYLLGLSILESARAYLDYREGRFELARERTYAAMHADSILESEGAFSLLELHRIQAAHNLVRIDLRAGECTRALSLAGDILSYLDGHVDGLPVHHHWRKRWLQQSPRHIRRRMAAQVAEEVALALMIHRDEESWNAFFIHVEPWLYAAGAGACPRVFLWIKSQAARFAGDVHRYLSTLGEFLPDGREDIPALWYFCVLEFLDFWETENSQLSKYVKDAILRDTSKWPDVPQIFRSCLECYGGGGASVANIGPVSAGGFGAPMTFRSRSQDFLPAGADSVAVPEGPR